jgi:hypothetical protein
MNAHNKPWILFHFFLHFLLLLLLPLGNTETTQNADENTWLAAACPATANALPMRFTFKSMLILKHQQSVTMNDKDMNWYESLTQNKSTAPMSGLIAKLAMQGNAIFIILLSKLSILGQIERISSVVELSACSLFDREASLRLPLVMGGTVSSLDDVCDWDASNIDGDND